MKSFIERVFKKRKQDAEQSKKLTTEVTEQVTEAAVEAIIKEVKKEIYSKPGHYFDDCNCFKCIRWRNQNA